MAGHWPLPPQAAPPKSSPDRGQGKGAPSRGEDVSWGLGVRQAEGILAHFAVLGSPDSARPVPPGRGWARNADKAFA